MLWQFAQILPEKTGLSQPVLLEIIWRLGLPRMMIQNRVEPSKTEPAKAEPATSETATVEPATSESSIVEPAKQNL